MGAIRTLEDLTVKGFDVKLGIRQCGGDEETYMEKLWAVMAEGTDKISSIRRVYEQKDYDGYRKEVHELKESMKSIGSTYLSQLAAEQESAVREGNYPVMQVGVEEMLTQYQFVVDALKELLGEA